MDTTKHAEEPSLLAKAMEAVLARKAKTAPPPENAATDRKAQVPAYTLVYARALNNWARSVGMSGSQAAIHLYVAGMLATNETCWTSVTGMARETRMDRKLCRKAISTGERFFTHSPFDAGGGEPSQQMRTWHLAMPMPTLDELSNFLPTKKANTTGVKAPPPPGGKSPTPGGTTPHPPLGHFTPQVKKNSPSVRSSLDEDRVKSGGECGGTPTTRTSTPSKDEQFDQQFDRNWKPESITDKENK